MDSSAPAAPSRCPLIDLVAVSTGWSPMACAQADDLGHVADRGRGRVRVDVRDVGAGQVGVGERLADRADEAGALRVRLHDVEAVRRDARPGEPGVDAGPPGGRVLGPFSSTITAAPSPSTNPSRPLSHGRDARSGSSLRVDIARIEAKPAIGSGWMTASVPPATTTSARPGPDDVQAERDRLGAGRAGAGHAVHAGLGPELETDPGRRAVGHQHRHGVRRDPARPARLQDVVLGEQGLRAADAGADADREPLPVDAGVARPESAQAWWAAISAIASERSSRRSFTRSITSAGSTAS